jgi:hypothetical protein
MKGFSQPKAIDCQPSSLDADIHGLGHRQAGGIPIGCERIRRDGYSGPAHAHGARTYDDKFRC